MAAANPKITIYDETVSGERTKAFTLSLATEQLTVRELIRRRVRHEVEEYNRSGPEYFRGIVQPTKAERTLNGYRIRARRALDWNEQFDAAVKAFQRNGFFILVGDEQVDGLDDELVFTKDTDVRFLKLMPLVGG